MAKRAGNRIHVTMGCTDCRERNYLTSKNRINDNSRIELKKYCFRCRTHTLHREIR